MAVAQKEFVVRHKKEFLNFDEITKTDFINYYRSVNMDNYFASTKKLLT